jgi:thiamine transport system permease protein
LAAAAAIVFVFSFTSFGVVLILGQLRYRTLEVAIYEAATSFLDLPTAAALSVLQLACVAVLLATAGRLSNRLAPPRLTTSLASPRRSRRTAGIVVAVSFGLLAVPLLALARRSVGGFSALATQPTGLGSPLAAVANSLRTAALAALLATLVGLPLARMGAGRRWGRAIDLLVMLPLGTSAVTVGLGFLVALGEPVDLRTSPLLIPIAHSLVAVPFVVRATGPLLSAIRPAIREAAAVLGANRQQVWTTIERPIVARAAALGGGMAAAVSLGEFGASAFIVRPESTTLPVLIARLLARPGAVNFSAAMALAVVLMGVTGLLVLAVDRLGEPRW